MNLYDWIIVALLVVSTLWGLRKGLVDAALLVVGVFVAMYLSGQFAATLVRSFTDSIESEALATAIGYVAIFVLVFIAARVVSGIIKTVMKITFLGWTDKLGGIGLGLVMGVLLSLALTMAAARYAYVFDPSSTGGLVGKAIDFGEGAVRERVDEQLTKSQLVPVLMSVRNAIPGSVLGLVPGDFNTALDILDGRVE